MIFVNEEINEISYQGDIEKADVQFTFSEEMKDDGSAATPIKPGLFDPESWPHPIVQLVLKNIRLKK